jgi:glycosyltransferase involved in cell wall biosynthesis
VASVAAGRPDVVLHGRLTPEQTSAVMQRARITVIPSTCPETFSRVAAESLARARPVLATEVGGLPHVVPADAGWLVTPSADAMAAGLVLAAGSASDRHAQAARSAYLARFSETVVTRQLLEVYEELIGARSSATSTAPAPRVPVPRPAYETPAEQLG